MLYVSELIFKFFSIFFHYYPYYLYNTQQCLICVIRRITVVAQCVSDSYQGVLRFRSCVGVACRKRNRKREYNDNVTKMFSFQILIETEFLYKTVSRHDCM